MLAGDPDDRVLTYRIKGWASTKTKPATAQQTLEATISAPPACTPSWTWTKPSGSAVALSYQFKSGAIVPAVLWPKPALNCPLTISYSLKLKSTGASLGTHTPEFDFMWLDDTSTS